MWLNEYISLDTNKVYNNQEFSIFYSGFLTNLTQQNESIVLRVGDENWENIQDIQMKRDGNNYKADISVSDFNEMNFCFGYMNNWDNNYNQNYNINIYEDPLANKEYNPVDYHSFLTDDFLSLYNINNEKKFDVYKERENSVKAKYLNLEPTTYDNLVSVESSDVELQQLKETLERLFPEENKSLAESMNMALTPEILSKKFSEYFSQDSVSEVVEKAFKEIDVEIKKSEIYMPIVPYRERLLEITREKEIRKGLIKEESSEPIRLIARTPYIELLRTVVKEKEITKALNEARQDEESTFLVVSPYTAADIYDDTVIGRFKQLKANIIKAFRKLNNYLQKRISGESEDINL